jgi:hypothetical protein
VRPKPVRLQPCRRHELLPPKVIKVFPGSPPGPPRALDVRILPGQGPDDYAKHAETIAYNLGLADVQVIGLEPYVIRLELVPKSAATLGP